MNRSFQCLLIVSTLLFSWLAMQGVHEFGHVLHAWIGGGTVTRIVLHPLAISRTDVDPNPRPLFVAWGGAIWGCALPLAGYAAARLSRWPHGFLAAFFAGFCLVANGAYLAGGSFSRAGDAGDLLRRGAPQWTLILFGLLTVAGGLRLWNGLGPHFGWGKARGQVGRKAAIGVSVALGVLLLIEWLTFSGG